MDIWIIRAGLAIFMLLGGLHLIYTLRDLQRPRYFAPRDRTLLEQLEKTQVAMAANPKNFWLSYMGFNLSHSQGVLVFVAVFGALSVIAPALIFHPALLTILIGTGALYSFLGYKFWFSVPFIGSLIGTLMFITGALIHSGA